MNAEREYWVASEKINGIPRRVSGCAVHAGTTGVALADISRADCHSGGSDRMDDARRPGHISTKWRRSGYVTKSTRRSCDWKAPARSCAEVYRASSSASAICNRRRKWTNSARNSKNNRMVRPSPAGAHPSAHIGRPCANRSSQSRLHSSCDGCCAGSTLRLERNSVANAERWRVCGNCRDLRFRLMPGSGRVLSRRVREYEAKTLDDLCLTGAIGWGRLSPHPATVDENGGRTRRVVPTSVAPITLFLRDEAEWMAPRAHGEDEEQEKGLSPVAREVLEFLRRRGASFFADIVRGTGQAEGRNRDGIVGTGRRRIRHGRRLRQPALTHRSKTPRRPGTRKDDSSAQCGRSMVAAAISARRQTTSVESKPPAGCC